MGRQMQSSVMWVTPGDQAHMKHFPQGNMRKESCVTQLPNPFAFHRSYKILKRKLFQEFQNLGQFSPGEFRFQELYFEAILGKKKFILHWFLPLSSEFLLLITAQWVTTQTFGAAVTWPGAVAAAVSRGINPWRAKGFKSLIYPEL